jgi:hypothetical protein
LEDFSAPTLFAATRGPPFHNFLLQQNTEQFPFIFELMPVGLWLAKTSQPISQTTWLKVNPIIIFVKKLEAIDMPTFVA